jgi:hypothetical protein
MMAGAPPLHARRRRSKVKLRFGGFEGFVALSYRGGHGEGDGRLVDGRQRGGGVLSLSQVTGERWARSKGRGIGGQRGSHTPEEEGEEMMPGRRGEGHAFP